MGRVVLVTGVAGDLSGTIARRLAEQAVSGRKIDKVVGVDVTAPAGELDGVKFVRADIRTPVIGKVMAVEEVDTVVHMALGPSLRNSSTRGGAKEINVIGTMQLLAACQRLSGVRKLVLRSNAAVYGTSPRDPAMFREPDSARGGTRSGYPKDAVEVESYVRGFSRRRPETLITTLRLATPLSHTIATPFANYLRSPVLPTVLGYDPRVQFLHPEDALSVLERAVLFDRPGTFNVAGDGVMTLSQVARRLGKPTLPLPAPTIGPALRRVLRQVGTDVPPEFVRHLTYGRVVDTTALREIFGYEPQYTTEDVFEEFRRSAGRGLMSVLTGSGR